MEQESHGHILCPVCHGRDAYHLADGRRKCRRCGKKFTHRRQISRLPNKTLRQIAVFFWLMVPASKVATDLQLNRKTVQRHYRLLRQAIGSAAEEKPENSGSDEAGSLSSGGGDGGTELPLVGLAIQGRTIRVSMEPGRSTSVESPEDIQAIIFASEDTAFRSRDLQELHIQLQDGRQSRAVEADYREEMLKFWRFVKGMIRMYRGKHRDDFALFMREVEFRFNQRHNPEVINILLRYLKQTSQG